VRKKSVCEKALSFFACRLEHREEKIDPALAEGALALLCVPLANSPEYVAVLDRGALD
jgi:hypothetical protein